MDCLSQGKEKEENKTNMKIHNKINIIIFLVVFLIIGIPAVLSLPTAPSVITIRNETDSPTAGAIINTSGGSITTMVLNATTQNLRWKAYVGNVTGTLTLDDANDYTIFDWSLTSVLGEVYATRASSSVSWPDVNCSTPFNTTNEEIALNHTSNPNDNISTTFSEQTHNSFYIGSREIKENSCYSLHTYVNDSSQSSDFEEILLHDKTNMVYATIIENNALGYNPNETFDFQMILPENGMEGWTSSTAYYFYVELT